MYDEELLLLMAAPQLCRPWKLFADYFAQNFTRIFKLHCAKSRSRLRLKMKIQNTILLSHLFLLISYVNTLANLVRGVILWHLCASGTNFPWDQPISFGCGGVQRGNLEYIWHGNILEKWILGGIFVPPPKRSHIVYSSHYFFVDSLLLINPCGTAVTIIFSIL